MIKSIFVIVAILVVQKSNKLSNMMENHTEKLYKLAVRGMLPKTKLGRKMLKKLKVYPENEHPHTAQLSK